MPGTTIPSVPHYVPAPPTGAENLEYANLAIIDLSKMNNAEGRAELVARVRTAMSTEGFFYAINHGYSAAQTERMFDIADVPFSVVKEEEKRGYVGKMHEGSYLGYKPRQYWHIDAGVRDQTESYNIHCSVTRKQHPQALRSLLPEIEAFTRYNHFNILHPILKLFALGLELPEDTFVNMYNFSDSAETYVRYMKYFPRSEDDEKKTRNVWLKGHTGVTLLWSQPVAALQLLQPDGNWRWVKHIDNALIVNAGDCMEFLSGGFYKATIHRVVQPPEDQRGYTRLGIVYFCFPDDDKTLVPLADSPVLQARGINRRFEDYEAPTVGTWRKHRTASYGQVELKPGKEEGVEEEVVNGIVVKHYN